MNHEGSSTVQVGDSSIANDPVDDPPIGMQQTRRGSLLILVAGISAMMLSLAVAFYVQVKSGTDVARVVQQDSQSRVMLSAALMYIQETARLGWGGDEDPAGINDPASEAYGWTDIRDGSPGPSGPARADSPRRVFHSPGRYPAPGSAMRGDAYCRSLPRYAVSPSVAPNPLRIPATDASGMDLHGDRSVAKNYLGKPLPGVGSEWDEMKALYQPVWNAVDKAMAETGTGNYSSQPIAETWGAFAAGERTPRNESVGLAWFRIYREQPQEHNGKPNDAGGDWFDTIPMTGHGVFIITVGSGSSRGYRFWNGNTDYLGGSARSAAYSPGLEPTTASGSGLFDEKTFQAVRASERIMWYRAEWTPWTSAGVDATESLGANVNLQAGLVTAALTRNASSKGGAYPFAGGSFAFVQRLEREPPRW